VSNSLKRYLRPGASLSGRKTTETFNTKKVSLKNIFRGGSLKELDGIGERSKFDKLLLKASNKIFNSNYNIDWTWKMYFDSNK